MSVSEGVKKPHRFRSGTKSRREMIKFRTKGEGYEKRAIAYAGVDRAIRIAIREVQDMHPGGFDDFGRIGTGVADRVHQVLVARVTRMLEGARLIRDVSKPRPGKAILLPRFLFAARRLPGVYQGRDHVTTEYYFPKKKAQQEQESQGEAQEQDA